MLSLSEIVEERPRRGRSSLFGGVAGYSRQTGTIRTSVKIVKLFKSCTTASR